LLASSEHYRFVISSLEDEEAREATERERQKNDRTEQDREEVAK
jgi:ATP-binding cassette subfamily B protein